MADRSTEQLSPGAATTAGFKRLGGDLIETSRALKKLGGMLRQVPAVPVGDFAEQDRHALRRLLDVMRAVVPVLGDGERALRGILEKLDAAVGRDN